MCNQLSKYRLLIAFLSLFQIAKAQDRRDEFNEKSPFELKFYADTVEIDIQDGIPNDVAKLNTKVLLINGKTKPQKKIFFFCHRISTCETILQLQFFFSFKIL